MQLSKCTTNSSNLAAAYKFLMVLIISAGFLLLAYALLIFTYKQWWGRLKEYGTKKQLENDSTPYLSVLVPARNEAQNISKLMEALDRQDYPKEAFEIILIDDHSNDGTAKLALNSGLTNLIVISAGGTADQSSKKKAIAVGVLQAKGALIVCTDADCIPPPKWLSTLASFYLENGASFIAAPVAYNFKNTPLQLLQTIDFLTLQGITAASVSAHFHTMCNGANLAYTKEAFNAVGGFFGIDKVASGDDMLLMHKIWKRDPNKVFYLKSREVIVYTQPMHHWKAFIQQRIRWASKTAYYEDKRVFWTLVLIYFVNVMFPVLLVTGFWNNFYWLAALFFLMLKTIIEWPFVASVAHFYNQKGLMKYFFFLQPLHIAYTVSIGLLSQMGSYEWKGRRTS
jgi:cellulose synthase/poly-beta-1,6-N-acetylglucosamine synthase-like glycosyltransferase